MALEFLRFMAGSLALLIPGILIAELLRLGDSRIVRWTYGSNIGLGLAAYLASALSHIDLRWFYPVWGCLALGLLARYILSRPASSSADSADRRVHRWMVPVLLLVAASQFAVALPHQLPNGTDPKFHLILARKIQLAQHAISDWEPFESIGLNYPTGSHTVLVVLSDLTGLPLHTIFKDLIPLLGVLSTAQIFVLARNVLADSTAALYAAMAYGVWAFDGSFDYGNWSGIPNEMGMLLFLAVLSAWLEPWLAAIRVAIMAILYAAVLLVHHHVMLVSGGILAVTWLYCRLRPAHRAAGRLLVRAVAVALVLDFFFVIPYAAKITMLPSTHVWQLGESQIPLWIFVRGIGYAFFAAALLGLVLWLMGSVGSCHPLLPCALAALLSMFALVEYGWPAIMVARGRLPWTAFTPSRFVTDLDSFLALPAGLAMAFLNRRLRLGRPIMLALMLLIAATQLDRWGKMAAGSDVAPDYSRACEWIRLHTSSSTMVISQDDWTPYMTWRRSIHTPVPVSEPPNPHPQGERVMGLLEGTMQPDAPDVSVVEITDAPDDPQFPVLWRGESGMKVVQLWPKMRGK